jgi:hypothetical protein
VFVFGDDVVGFGHKNLNVGWKSQAIFLRQLTQ